MQSPFLETLIPASIAEPRWRRVWLAALLLFPAALVAGFVMLVRTEPRPPVPVLLTIPKAEAVAKSFARSQGIDAANWRANVSFSANNPLLSFVNGKEERRRLWTIAPPLYAIVKLTAPVASPEVGGKVYLALDGKILGFEWKNAPVIPGDLTEEERRRKAGAWIPAGFDYGPPSLEKKDETRLYTYHSKAVRDTDLKADVTFLGNRVVAFKTTAKVDDNAAQDPEQDLQTILSVLGTGFAVLVVLFSMYRYASRATQKEVSHSRSLTVAALCALFCTIIGFNATLNGEIGELPLLALTAVFVILGLIGGALLAAAYGSGEGDIREAYPGKLTSLDVLLTGNLFSRNVGQAIVTGMVVAGWLVLALSLASIPFRHESIRGSEAMVGPLMRFTWVMPFVTYPLIALAFAAGGLLQPLAFLSRFLSRAKRWHLPLLLLAAGLVATMRNHSPSNGEFLIASSLFVTALVAPFFLHDFLATLVCVTVMFATVSLSVSFAILPDTTTTLAIHIAVFTATALFGIFAARYGKIFAESQVRPLYAKHIEERKSLEAEVGAAREAQLRLLPQAVPDFAGVEIAAACVPAETVGGDFYDFFPLGDGRLGIFLAEGNSRGLAAALTIALAKGYLMHTVEKYRDPVEILSRLEAALGSIFAGSSSGDNAGALTDFAFASIDTRTGELRYARTGAYPKVVIHAASEVQMEERLVPVRGRLEPIVEGSAHLASGDQVFLFTDGIGHRIAADGNCRAEEAATRLATKRTHSVAELQHRFLSAAAAAIEPDDLTVVILQLRTEDATVLWGAA